ncbi:MAG: ribosome maturation factor RimP [Ruminococcaceae bacterium]|nr:ribosome maturation factor RimP [Oscillospiraceae bacterium]
MSKTNARPAKNIAGRVKELLEPTVNGLGYVLWDVEYVKEGAEWFLRITLDSEEGININDCEKVHMEISPMLDEADPIEGSYRLEVSSPGIERDLKNPMHYKACLGWDVEVRLFTALDGRKVIKGILAGYDEDENKFLIDENGNETVLDKSIVSKIKTVYEFD